MTCVSIWREKQNLYGRTGPGEVLAYIADSQTILEA